MIRRYLFLGTSVLAILAACGAPKTPAQTAQTAQIVQTAQIAQIAQQSAPPGTRGKPKLGTFGVDIAGADTSTKPGKDFYAHAGGKWMKENQIPADRSRWGMFDILREESDVNVRRILDEQKQARSEPGSTAQKI